MGNKGPEPKQTKKSLFMRSRSDRWRNRRVRGSYHFTTSLIICLKGKIKNVSKANMSTQQHVESDRATAQPVSQNVVRTRLPKLSLPKFRGDVTKWNTFWDSFQVAVHRNEGISNIDKFNYLNYVLEGVAARAIPGLTLTEVNYDAAVKLLRFGHDVKEC